jgi:hypothetical protein
MMETVFIHNSVSSGTGLANKSCMQELATFPSWLYLSPLAGEASGGRFGGTVQDTPGGSAKRKYVSERRFICPSAQDLFDSQELEKAIGDAHDFHTKGGNLKALQHYLDQHMQSTLDKLQLQFTFSGGENPTKHAVDDLKHYYSANKVKRGGYGQSLPGDFHGERLDLLTAKRWIDVIEPATSERQNTAVGPFDLKCEKLVQFGNGNYETKFMCAPVESKTETKEDTHGCHLFSVGSNDQWGFEEAARIQVPHCQTHTFDCTLQNGKPQKKPKDENVHFYDRCIGEKAGNPKYKGYEALANETGINSPPKYLKMDVEGFEYQVLLESVLAAPQKIWPEQIMVETHWSSRMVDLPWMLRHRQAGELALFYSSLYHRGGYIPVHTRNFRGCEPCMEVLLAKVLCTEDM